MDYWPQFYFDFFTNNQQRVTKILNARSCREMWIQGEMFLTDEKHIRLTSKEFTLVDIHGLPSDEESSEVHPEMITEIKVVSFRGYSRQDILGFGGRALLQPVLSAQNVQNDFSKITDYPEPKELKHSVFKDYLKLKKIATTKIGKQIFKGEKYLILVIPYLESASGSQNPNVDTVMKNALEKIMLAQEPNYWNWEFRDSRGEKEFVVRLWRITDTTSST